MSLYPSATEGPHHPSATKGLRGPCEGGQICFKVTKVCQEHHCQEQGTIKYDSRRVSGRVLGRSESHSKLEVPDMVAEGLARVFEGGSGCGVQLREVESFKIAAIVVEAREN